MYRAKSFPKLARRHTAVPAAEKMQASCGRALHKLLHHSNGSSSIRCHGGAPGHLQQQQQSHNKHVSKGLGFHENDRTIHIIFSILFVELVRAKRKAETFSTIVTSLFRCLVIGPESRVQTEALPGIIEELCFRYRERYEVQEFRSIYELCRSVLYTCAVKGC